MYSLLHRIPTVRILFLFWKTFLIFSMRCGICLSVIEKLISSKQGLGKIVWCGLMLVSQLMSGLSSDRCHHHQPIREEYGGCGPIRGGHLSPTHLAWCEKKLQYLFYIRRKLEELVLLVGRSQDSRGKDCQTFCVLSSVHLILGQVILARVLGATSRQNDGLHAIVSSSHNQSRAFNTVTRVLIETQKNCPEWKQMRVSLLVVSQICVQNLTRIFDLERVSHDHKWHQLITTRQNLPQHFLWWRHEHVI